MKHWSGFLALGRVGLALVMFSTVARAADGSVILAISNNIVSLKVDGDKDDDWRMQSSADLTTWTTLTNFGTWLSGNETNAFWRSVGVTGEAPPYYRALRT